MQCLKKTTEFLQNYIQNEFERNISIEFIYINVKGFDVKLLVLLLLFDWSGKRSEYRLMSWK